MSGEDKQRQMLFTDKILMYSVMTVKSLGYKKLLTLLMVVCNININLPQVVTFTEI